jgi:cyanate lyase
VLGFLLEKPTSLYDFLRICSEKISLGSDPFHWGGLPRTRVQQLIEIIGPELLRLARQLYGDGIIDKVDFEEYEKPTDKQRLRQFILLAERCS